MRDARCLVSPPLEEICFKINGLLTKVGRGNVANLPDAAALHEGGDTLSAFTSR
jgi:hypothetical protein